MVRWHEKKELTCQKEAHNQRHKDIADVELVIRMTPAKCSVKVS